MQREISIKDEEIASLIAIETAIGRSESETMSHDKQTGKSLGGNSNSQSEQPDDFTPDQKSGTTSSSIVRIGTV